MTSIDSPQLHDDRGPTRGDGAAALRSIGRIRISNTFALPAIVLGTLLLRLPLVGGPPNIDDGFYIFSADVVWRGNGTFPVGPINLYAPLIRQVVELYPPLLHWVGMPPASPFFYFRVTDAFVAAGAAAMVFLFLSRWTESRIAFVMASGWSIASNLPEFVDSGFKNSIMAATFVYMGALCFLSSRSRWSPFWAGLLIPLAIFLREAFFPIVLISVYLAFMLHGRRGLIVHIAGLAAAGCALVLWLGYFRGPPLEILRTLRVDMPLYFAQVDQRRNLGAERLFYLRIMLKATMWLMPPALLGIGWILSPGRGERVAKGLAILLFLPPLYEIFVKHVGAYHWAQLLLGVAFLGAKGLQRLVAIGRSSNRWVAIGGLIAMAWLVGELDARSVFRAYWHGYRLSREFAPVMIWGRWDDPSVEKSLFLEVSKYVRDNTNPDDRILLTAYWQTVHSLSERLPPSMTAFETFYMFAMKYPERRPDVIEMLRQHPPRLIIETSTLPVRLNEFWPDFEKRYRLARKFSRILDKHFGTISVEVWELRE